MDIRNIMSTFKKCQAKQNLRKLSFQNAWLFKLHKQN